MTLPQIVRPMGVITPAKAPRTKSVPVGTVFPLNPRLRGKLDLLRDSGQALEAVWNGTELVLSVKRPGRVSSSAR